MNLLTLQKPFEMNYFLSIVLLLILLYNVTMNKPKEADKDGLIYYLVNTTETDTTYTLFSVFGMRQGIEYEIGDTLIERYNRNELCDSLSIDFSKGKVYGVCLVQSKNKTTRVDYSAYKYIWRNGSTQLVPQK